MLQRPRGLRIGNLTSQHWANVYLNELDQYAKRELKCRAYIRYVDYFLAFADNKIQLNECLAAIIKYLQRLRLTLHENCAQPRPAGATHFRSASHLTGKYRIVPPPVDKITTWGGAVFFRGKPSTNNTNTRILLAGGNSCWDGLSSWGVSNWLLAFSFWRLVVSLKIRPGRF